MCGVDCLPKAAKPAFGITIVDTPQSRNRFSEPIDRGGDGPTPALPKGRCAERDNNGLVEAAGFRQAEHAGLPGDYRLEKVLSVLLAVDDPFSQQVAQFAA
jgi:hypothetical protein